MAVATASPRMLEKVVLTLLSCVKHAIDSGALKQLAADPLAQASMLNV